MHIKFLLLIVDTGILTSAAAGYLHPVRKFDSVLEAYFCIKPVGPDLLLRPVPDKL